ncbi:uncharacterized protein LOC113381681 [Ctenocephalides felis]|uniref:uncharacterized protein LOC113381681 n=1 Tax=Ctenocephalides felis TaxID=7515 RepID=UPI000E6E49AA|nr:uncharacterized protein LOC113381681 [Ctenocephalides felis]
MSDNDRVERTAVLVSSLIILKKKEEKERRKRLWSRSWLLRRDQQTTSLNMVFNELDAEDPASFSNYTRMENGIGNDLLEMVTPYIKKEDTVMRQAISQRDRLCITIRYLATGNSFRDISYSTRVAPNTISQIVRETLEAIITVLQDNFIKFPSSAQEWEAVAHKFETTWNFPHCIGALDGKHIRFRPSRSDGSKFRNYKGYDSIVLLALADVILSYKIYN